MSLKSKKSILCKKKSRSRRRFYLLTTLMVCLVLFWNGVTFCEDADDVMEFIFFFPDSTVKNPVDATNALQTYMNIIKRKKGWNLRGYFFKKQRDLDKFLATRKVELGVFSPVYMIENYKRLKLVPFAAPMRNGKQTYRKTIVVRKEDGLRDIHDLKDKVLAATALGEDNIPFYNKIVFKGEIDIRTHFKETLITDSLNSAILAVLYQKADAAAVALTSFNIIRELNPQARQKLVSIFTSDETPISALCYFEDNFDTSLLPEFKEILMTQHLDPVGQQSFLAFNVEAWAETSMEDYRETERIINEFNKRMGQDAAPSMATDQPIVGSPDIKKVEPKPEPVNPFKKFQIYREGDNTIIFSVTLLNTIKASQAELSYKVNNDPEKTMKMEVSDPQTFQHSINVALADKSPAKEVSHMVRPGDTLAKIAKKYLGNTKKYMLIARFNKIENPNLIFVNQKLRITTGEVKLTEVTGQVTIKTDKGELTSLSKKKTFF